jgi:exodeoxyribonuclease VII large subunit
MQTQTNQKIYTVSELNADIKALLESQYPFVWIHAEISNFRQPISGHFYFTLKDESAQISAVMFRGQQRRLKFMPEDGMTVTGMGRLSVYEPRGTYQIILEYLEPYGIGALQIAFEKLKQKLADDGLFDESHKKSLPFMPKCIGILTSLSGAVIHDFLKIIDQRFTNVNIQVVPVKVQGDGAPEEIVAGLQLLNERDEADVAILARGGGSLEDLQAFNTEMVARAIFDSKIPVISAIGHETDYSIADFVADMRAPTPTAAAEMVVPEKAEIKQRIVTLRKSLYSIFYSYIDRLKLELKVITQKLVDPRKAIQVFQMRIDDLSTRLHKLMVDYVKTKRQPLDWWNDRLSVNNPMLTLLKLKTELEIYYHNILRSHRINIDIKRAQLRELEAKLEALSPHAVLKRGYSITRTTPGSSVVRDAETIELQQELEILLAKGQLFCRVKGKLPDGSENIRTIDEST